MQDHTYPEEQKYQHFERLLRQMRRDRRIIDNYFNKRIQEIKNNVHQTNMDKRQDIE